MKEANIHYGNTILQGISSVAINGNTDVNGNLAVLSVGAGIPLFFVPESGSYDGNVTLFISSSTFATYIHLSEFSNGNSLPYKNLKGTVYYMPFG